MPTRSRRHLLLACALLAGPSLAAQSTRPAATRVRTPARLASAVTLREVTHADSARAYATRELAHVDSVRAAATREISAREDGTTVVHVELHAERAWAPRTLVLIDTIPAGMRLVGSSAVIERADASVAYSVDGGRTFASSPMESVQVGGAAAMRLVSPDRVTHIRWMVAGAVQAGEVVRADYQLRAAARPRTEAVAGM